jgi:hypothetical protein
MGKRAKVQTALRLDEEVMDRLRQGGRVLADEIRDRVDWTLEIEPCDAATKDFLRQVARMAADIERETGSPWHQHAGSHAALRQALLSRLKRLQPEGSAAFGARPHQSGAASDPQEIGVWSEHETWEIRDRDSQAWLHFRAAKEKSWREILAIHRDREGSKS